MTEGQDYPTRPITIHVGYNPGASAGNSAQLFAEHARKYIPNSQPILVNFKPGAASAVAADFVIKQPADGYNLFWISLDLCAKLAKDGHLLSFKLEDFIFLGAIGLSPQFLAVEKKKNPFQRVEDFIEHARKNPGKLSYASTGMGSATHLTSEIFQTRSGIKLNHIPFDGIGAALSAILGGHVDSVVTSTVAIPSHIRPGGGLRVLIFFGPERWIELPDVPTAIEKGYAMDRVVFFGLAARKGTPPPVVDTLVRTFKKTSEDPNVKAGAAKIGFVSGYLGPEETKKRAEAEFATTKEFYKILGL